MDEPLDKRPFLLLDTCSILHLNLNYGIFLTPFLFQIKQGNEQNINLDSDLGISVARVGK